MTEHSAENGLRAKIADALRGHRHDSMNQDSGHHCKCGSDSRFEQRDGDRPWSTFEEHLADIVLLVLPPAERATGAIVPERQRCLCNDGLCLDHCRACNHSGRDLEECCIADPEWEPDDEYLAIREASVFPPAVGGSR